MVICHKCKLEHDGSYGSGKFCSSKCARSYSTSKNREEINKKVSKTLKGYRIRTGGKTRICEYGCHQDAKYKLDNNKWCCEDSYTKCSNIKFKNSNGLRKAHKEGRTYKPTKESIEKAVKSRLRNLELHYLSLSWEKLPDGQQRKRILLEQNFKCSICGLNNTWNEKELKFHYDHIDGNRKNNSRENVRYICPNCHTQTDTYCRGKTSPVSDDIILNELIKNNFNINKTLLKLDLVPGARNWSKAKKISLKYFSNGDVA